MSTDTDTREKMDAVLVADPFFAPLLKLYGEFERGGEAAENLASLKGLLAYHHALVLQEQPGDADTLEIDNSVPEFCDRLIDYYATGCNAEGREFVRGMITSTWGDPVAIAHAVRRMQMHLDEEKVIA